MGSDVKASFGMAPYLVKGPFLRTAYNYDMGKASDESALGFRDEYGDPIPSLAKQEFADEVDINTIVKRFGLTGELPDSPRPPMTGDFTDVVDYQSALNSVLAAQAGFLEFPAELRARFNNDPQRMLEFLADGSNRDEAIKLGLVPKPAEVPRDAVKAIDELAAKLTVPKAAG